ncbi:MAG: hypothetical protein NUV31_09800 [Dehalococcoidales bacterium]|nr:hypothetical protein [Dehalococcoidales bacterium]
MALTNRLDGFSPELETRFAVRKIEACIRSDFLIVVRGVLVRLETVSQDIAAQIAKMPDGKPGISGMRAGVARMIPQLGEEKAIRLLSGF